MALINHIWILGLVVMYVNLAIGRVRMRGLIADGTLSAPEANRLCVRAAIVLTAVGGAFEVVSLSTGISPLCQLLLPITDRAILPLHIFTLLSGAVLLYWVWKLDGARTLALVGPAFTRGLSEEKKYTPGQVRVAVTGLLALAWGGYIVARLVMPLPTEIPGCPPQSPGIGAPAG